MGKLLTIAEVAGICRKSKKTIYRWIDEGKVFRDVRRVRDGYLIPEEEVERVVSQENL
jgi:excisionase family DNA binding protein